MQAILNEGECTERTRCSPNSLVRNGSIHHFLRLQLRSEQDAEDALAEVFRRVHKGREKFRGDCPERVWIMRIAANVALRQRQISAKHRHASLEELGEGEWKGLAMDGHVERDAVNKAFVETVLSGLPPEQRAAVWLRVALEYTDEETAEILGVPTGTVKSWVWRSLARLKRAYADQASEVLSP